MNIMVVVQSVFKGEHSSLLHPGDQSTVQIATELAEAAGGKVTALAVGSQPAKDDVELALNMGANHGIWVNTSIPDQDVWTYAKVLQAVLQGRSIQLILSSGDTDRLRANQAMACLAGILDQPFYSSVHHVEIRNTRLSMIKEGLSEGLSLCRPVILTINLPKCAAVPYSAKRSLASSLECLGVEDLGLSEFIGPKFVRVNEDSRIEQHPEYWLASQDIKQRDVLVVVREEEERMLPTAEGLLALAGNIARGGRVTLLNLPHSSENLLHSHATELVKAIRETKPSIILLHHGPHEIELASFVSGKLALGVADDCADIGVEDGEVIFTYRTPDHHRLRKKGKSEPILATVRLAMNKKSKGNQEKHNV